MNITITTTTTNKTNEAIELLKRQLRSAQIQQNWRAVERIEKRIEEISSQQ